MSFTWIWNIVRNKLIELTEYKFLCLIYLGIENTLSIISLTKFINNLTPIQDSYIGMSDKNLKFYITSIITLKRIQATKNMSGEWINLTKMRPKKQSSDTKVHLSLTMIPTTTLFKQTLQFSTHCPRFMPFRLMIFILSPFVVVIPLVYCFWILE